MKGSFLSLSVDTCAKLEDIVVESSESVSRPIAQQWLWSSQNRADSDKMCSIPQLLWLKNIALDRRANRVLDIGCYTGLSAMSWFEGTVKTSAEIITIEADPDLASISQKFFTKHGYNNRITVVELEAPGVLASLTGAFDIIFVDIAFEAYLRTVQSILECNLLAPHGIILVDNVFARGYIVDENNTTNVDLQAVKNWQTAGSLMTDFKTAIKNDTRVSASIIPIFDGVSEIRWKIQD